MASRWNTLVAGLVMFAAGLALGWFLRPPVDPMPLDSVSRFPDPFILQILDRLEEIENGLDARGFERVASSGEVTEVESAPPIPARQVEPDLRAFLEASFAALSEQVHRSTAGIGEIAKLKPTPDVPALSAFRESYLANPQEAIRRISGMQARDATLEFGVPTLKVTHTNVRGPSRGKLTHWLWEAPDAGFEVMMGFEEGVAHYASVGDLGRLRRHIEGLKER